MRYFFPAIFHNAEEGGFWISFPDLPECITEGDTMEQAYEMAWDALGLCLYDRINSSEAIPQPSDVSKIRIKKNSFVVIIEFDMDMYLKKHNTRAVKKTLSIPQWLNEKAVSKGINFSQVLQEALLDRLGA